MCFITLDSAIMNNLPSLFRDMLHLICLLHFFTCLFLQN